MLLKDRCIVAASFGIFLLATSAVHRQLTNVENTNEGSQARDLENANTDETNRRELVGSEPEGAWLMHYPSSGAEKIVQLIQTVTGKATGTNYGNVVQMSNGMLAEDTFPSLPIWKHHPHGPFIFRDSELPDTFIPVTTSCAGTCTDCHPDYYMTNKYEFLKQCSTGIKFKPAGNGSDEKLTYDHGMIKKAVQLIRPPMDNVVARYLQVRKDKAVMDDEVWLNKFPESKFGFDMWCADVGNRFDDEESEHWGTELFELAAEVPCRQEFYRYIQWHNYVYEVTKNDMADIPVTLVHTYDLQTNFQETMSHLLGFYRLTPTETTPLTDFNGLELDIPSYSRWFDKEDKKNIACFMKKLATSTTTNRLGRYLTDCEE